MSKKFTWPTVFLAFASVLFQRHPCRPLKIIGRNIRFTQLKRKIIFQTPILARVFASEEGYFWDITNQTHGTVSTLDPHRGSKIHICQRDRLQKQMMLLLWYMERDTIYIYILSYIYYIYVHILYDRRIERERDNDTMQIYNPCSPLIHQPHDSIPQDHARFPPKKTQKSRMLFLEHFRSVSHGTSLLPVFKELRVKPSMIPISKTSGIPSQAAKTVPRFTKVTRADTLQVAPLAKAWKACEGIYVVDCHGFLVVVSIKLKTKLLRKPDFFSGISFHHLEKQVSQINSHNGYIQTEKKLYI